MRRGKEKKMKKFIQRRFGDKNLNCKEKKKMCENI